MGSHRRTIAAAVATTLASVSLYPIFIGTQWFWAGLGATLMVAIGGTVTRLRRLPFAACLAIELAVLLYYLNLAFEGGRSRFGLVPTPTSLSLLWKLAGQGFHESAKYAPPVPELPGMVLLAAAGIGLTALLTDLITVRLENAALGGLPLLLLFTEPFTLSVSRSGVGTVIAFCLGTAGYLAMLSSEGRDRIREWERPNPGPDEIPDTRALATTGRRVGFAAVALALFIPVFIPGLHTTRLFGGQPGIGGIPVPGGAGFPDPNTQLSNELHESKAKTVLTYSSTDEAPGYFQLYVLDKLTDSGWQLFGQQPAVVPAGKGLPAPPGMTRTVGTTSQTTSVTVSDGVGQDQLAALPAPYPATFVGAPGTVKADRNSLMIFDSGVRLSGLQYTVTSLDQSISDSDLNSAPPAPSSITSHYMDVPQSYVPLRALAEQVVGNAKAKTHFEEALALQNWLNGPAFRYTLTAPTITSAQGLATFLDSTKKGYCQQFSFAMATLARLLGIPARIAYGFTAGKPAGGGSWQVTTHDAHSWPELYFQGFGWLRFEPTPAGQAGQGTATAPSYTQQAASPFAPQPQTTSPASGPAAANPGAGGIPAALRQKLAFEFGAGGGEIITAHQDSLTAWDVFLLSLLSLLGLLVLVSAAPACARGLIRRRRWRAGERGGDAGLAHAAWRELRDDLVDYRAGYQLSESPRALAARVSASLELTGPAVDALRRITMASERARYSDRPQPGAGLREDSAVVRRAIAAAAPRRTRWLARLVPSSVLTPAMIRLAQAVDFSGRLNFDRLAGPRLGRAGSGRAGQGGAGPVDEDMAHRTEPLAGAGARRD